MAAKLAEYRKLIAYLVAAAVLLANRYFGTGADENEVVGQVDLIVDAAIYIAGAFAVERLANAPQILGRP